MPSTDTTDSSLIQRAMDRPLEEKLATKSVRLKQATEAILATDAAAGLAENRRSTKAYNQQADRATEHMVSNWISSGQAGRPGGNKSMPEDDDTVNLDLGDRYQEIHNHPAPTVSGGQPSVTRRVAGSFAKKWLPLILAGTLGPAAGVLGSWWFNKGDAVNVKDVQSKFKVEVYDENGTLIQTLPYSELPKQ